MNETLQSLFQLCFSEPVRELIPISAHASARRLVRLRGETRSAVAVESSNVAENKAFISFSRHFRSAGLSVPEIFCVADNWQTYLQEDLGDSTLFSVLQSERPADGTLSQRVIQLYEEVVRQLSYFQIEAGQGIDYSMCVEGLRYDRDAMLYDCAVFMRELVGRMAIPVAADRIQGDFNALVDFLARAESSYFMYRDFQARNIMIRENVPYFIDYQSGRYGALQYDLASLLYQSQAQLPESMRAHFVDTYLAQVSLRRQINRDQFLEYFDGFVLIRLIQVLGAYGRLGLGENKEYFLKGIPFAVATFLEVLARRRLSLPLAEITALFGRLAGTLDSLYKKSS